MSPNPNVILFDEEKIKRYVQRIPKGFGINPKVSKAEGLSEYQAAYRKYPFHPPRQCFYPQKNKIDYTGSSKFITTYKRDYVRHDEKDVRGESFKPDLKYNPSSSKFQGFTIYQMSYNTFDADTLKKCRRSAIRPGDPRKPIEGPFVPVNKDTKAEQEKTVQSTEKTSTENSVPEANSPEVKEKEKAPEKTDTADQPKFNRKIVTTNLSKTKERLPFRFVTTFMEDYPKHPHVARQPPCKPPPSSNHMVSEKGAFDGRTTQSIAYKAWPVRLPEKPKWAIKPEYKRPPAGISFNSTYMFDFRDPGKISRVEAIKPSSGNDIIKHVDGEGDSSGNTTYQVSYPEWTGAMPAQTYHQKPVYVPPEKEMEFQSTQRSHFKGEPAERALLCRKTSEHRQMDKEKRMYFRTTYQDTFRDPRPRSCPATFTVSTPLQIRSTPVQRSNTQTIEPDTTVSEKID